MANRIKCEACRTINLAKQIQIPKTDMQQYEKCAPTTKIPYSNIPELPLYPTYIKVCSREECGKKKAGFKDVPFPGPYYNHGMFMWLIKTGIVAGALWWTTNQGVWGDQRTTMECVTRWEQYIRAFKTRRPPVFDSYNRPIVRENKESFLAPLYGIYKEIVTTCFSGIYKFPLVVKCMYLDYMQAQNKRAAELKAGNRSERQCNNK